MSDSEPYKRKYSNEVIENFLTDRARKNQTLSTRIVSIRSALNESFKNMLELIETHKRNQNSNSALLNADQLSCLRELQKGYKLWIEKYYELSKFMEEKKTNPPDTMSIEEFKMNINLLESQSSAMIEKLDHIHNVLGAVKQECKEEEEGESSVENSLVDDD